jgi:hypothetical protein
MTSVLPTFLDKLKQVFIVQYYLKKNKKLKYSKKILFMFCGEPLKGVHSVRLWGFAAFDVIGSLAVSFLLSYATGMNIILSILVVLLAGIVAHRYFHIRTTLDKFLFP